jgi:hypothetical protein
MVRARLKAPPDQVHRIIESSEFRCAGGVLRDAAGSEVAVHSQGVWRYELRIYISVDFDEPVVIHLSNPAEQQTRRFGPAPLRLIGGSMWQMGYVPEVIAQFDDVQRVWRLARAPSDVMPEFSLTAAERVDRPLQTAATS